MEYKCEDTGKGKHAATLGIVEYVLVPRLFPTYDLQVVVLVEGIGDHSVVRAGYL